MGKIISTCAIEVFLLVPKLQLGNTHGFEAPASIYAEYLKRLENNSLEQQKKLELFEHRMFPS